MDNAFFIRLSRDNSLNWSAVTSKMELIGRYLGKTRWEDRNGTKVKVKVPESERITREDARLRIVDETLWQAAHARLDRTRATYLRGAKGRLWSRPESGLEAGAPGLPKYLLTGFLECVVCHGGMHTTKRTSQRGAPAYYYVCREHRVRGGYRCTNSLSAPMVALHDDLIEQLRGDVLSPRGFEAVLDRALELERSPEEPDRRGALADEVARLEREIGCYTDAGAQGGSLPSILAALQERDRRRAELQAQLEHQDGLGRAARVIDSRGVRRELHELLDDWRGLLEGGLRRLGRFCASSSRGGS